MENIDDILSRVASRLQQRTPLLDKGLLGRMVESFLSRRQEFIDAATANGSPLYIFEPDVIRRRALQIKNAFESVIPRVEVYYALKSNYYRGILDTLVKEDFGLDVSSGWELEQALEAGATKIIFSGPGKTDKELRLAVEHVNRVTVLLDSFGELERLQKVAQLSENRIRAGVRLTIDEHGLWRKFGIPLKRLESFFEAVEKCENVLLRGLQFHSSWNLNPDNQTAFLVRLGQSLKNLSRHYRSQIEFIDIGGGYWPEQGEWLRFAATPEGQIVASLKDSPEMVLDHFALKASPIGEFAERISRDLVRHVFPLCDCRIYLEPGRWICNDALHLLLTVIDRKNDDLVITDGGTNMIGWERFESDYFPVINLSRPGPVENSCMVLGSLCTPHDVWGFSYFGEDIQPGDVLLIPWQGAYTYSLRQQFIKPLPGVASIGQGSFAGKRKLEMPSDDNSDYGSVRANNNGTEKTANPNRPITRDRIWDRIWGRIEKNILPKRDELLPNKRQGRLGR